MIDLMEIADTEDGVMQKTGYVSEACATILFVHYLVSEWNLPKHQADGANSTVHMTNSTANLMTVEKSLMVADMPSVNSSYVEGRDVDFLIQPITSSSRLPVSDNGNQSLQKTVPPEKDLTSFLPIMMNTDKNSTAIITAVTFNGTAIGHQQTAVSNIKPQENTPRNRTIEERKNFTSSPYLGSIPEEHIERYRLSHASVTKLTSGSGNIGSTGNKYSHFGIGSVSEPIYYNSPNNQTLNGKKIIGVVQNSSIAPSSKGNIAFQQWLERKNISTGSYVDVKPEESSNSFPYHYEGGDVSQSKANTWANSHGSSELGGSYPSIHEQSKQHSGINQYHVDQNQDFQDSPRIPVSPPPWMVPPPLYDSSNDRFPIFNNRPDITPGSVKPVRFEHNIDAVVFTTELPRSGQLEAPVLHLESNLQHGQNYDVYSYGSTHKMSAVSKALKFLAAIVPLGLFVAALTPAVVHVNATQLMSRRPQQLSEGRDVTDRLPSGAATSAVEAEQCDMREVCEAAIRGADGNDSGTTEERVYWILAHKSPKTVVTTFGLDELFSVIRRKSCDSFFCNKGKLPHESLETSTSLPSSTSLPTSQLSSSIKRRKKKKKKIPQVSQRMESSHNGAQG